MPRWLDRLLPKLDVEGEAVEREIGLADWPTEPGMAIAADDLRAATASDDEQPAFADVHVRIGHGGTLLVTGETRVTRPLLLALAGRLSAIEGRLRVDGMLLPERAGAVRSRVGMALLDDPDAALGEVSRAVAGRTRFAVLCDVDRLDADTRSDIAEVLRRAAAEARDCSDDASSAFTLVVSARDERRALALLADAHRPDVTSLALPAPHRHRPDPESSADLSEVFA